MAKVCYKFDLIFEGLMIAAIKLMLRCVKHETQAVAPSDRL